jgi:hypothetical protein
MHTPSRVEAAFTATLSAALLALGVTAVATVGRSPAAEPALQATLPAVTVVGQRATLEAACAQPMAEAAQSDGSVARKAS